MNSALYCLLSAVWTVVSDVIELCGFDALQAAFNVSNDNDAEVSLQIANASTQALVSYRMKMMPVLVCLVISRLVPDFDSTTTTTTTTTATFLALGYPFPSLKIQNPLLFHKFCQKLVNNKVTKETLNCTASLEQKKHCSFIRHIFCDPKTSSCQIQKLSNLVQLWSFVFVCLFIHVFVNSWIVDISVAWKWQAINGAAVRPVLGQDIHEHQEHIAMHGLYHDGHKPRRPQGIPWRPQQWKQKINGVLLRNRHIHDIVGQISPSYVFARHGCGHHGCGCHGHCLWPSLLNPAVHTARQRKMFAKISGKNMLLVLHIF